MIINNIEMPFRTIRLSKLTTAISFKDDVEFNFLAALSIRTLKDEFERFIDVNGPVDAKNMFGLILRYQATTTLPIIITSILSEPMGGSMRVGSHGECKSVDIMIPHMLYGNMYSIEFYSRLPFLRWVSQTAFTTSPMISIGVEFDHLHLEVRGHERYEASVSFDDLIANIPKGSSANTIRKFLHGTTRPLTDPHSPVFLFYSYQEYYTKGSGVYASSFRMPFGTNNLIKYM